MMLFIGGPANGMYLSVANVVDLQVICVTPSNFIYPLDVNQVHVAGTEQHRYVRYSLRTKYQDSPIPQDFFIHDSLTTVDTETIAKLISRVTNGE